MTSTAARRSRRVRMIAVGDTVRLICPVTGAFRGLVRAVRIPTADDGSPTALYTVWAETPILDWLTTGHDGRYPYQMPYEVGHRFNAEARELQAQP
jgi:hypothetical protein